ncbi:DUF2939 domain-containing protein [Paraburkholderia acidisoli]|uniref:DUF2939 domain-containing protein n=1 Tax=Paraburkholderia acidisoli TaxID=2571748 RepID=A0A7Z2GGZ3_9BURK|nr:DUF2939 domain-containing protein [Paraburkholderia acidisoli]QGZ61632.1 DUF2939 domain-containing protein [Paraburkholderia acidisoli]
MTESRTNPPNWKKPVAITVAVIAVVAVIGYGYASPYIAANRMKAAADARDAATLNEYVDYPALRMSLKQQVGDMLQQRIHAQHSSNPLLLFGAVIGAALIGPLVDAYATPDGVAALLNGMPPTGKPGEHPAPPPPQAPNELGESGAPPAPPVPASATPPAPPQAAQTPPAAGSRPVTAARYRSLNEFALTWDRGTTGEHYAAILQRHGLFSWKLAAVELNEGNTANTP